jgi:hypothetical protein
LVIYWVNSIIWLVVTNKMQITDQTNTNKTHILCENGEISLLSVETRVGHVLKICLREKYTRRAGNMYCILAPA